MVINYVIGLHVCGWKGVDFLIKSPAPKPFYKVLFKILTQFYILKPQLTFVS